MQYMSKKWCSHWTVCVWSCARMWDVSIRALEMSLSGGSVRRVNREVRLAMVDECGVPVRLMTMGRMSTSVHGQWLRMALARGVYLARMSCCPLVYGHCENTTIPCTSRFGARNVSKYARKPSRLHHTAYICSIFPVPQQFVVKLFCPPSSTTKRRHAGRDLGAIYR
jgi:hypothetical protein